MKQTLKKGIVCLLSLAMTLSTTLAGNVTAFATSADPITLSKTATPVSGTTDTWEVQLKISGTEQSKVTTSDIVLVLDTSGSMNGQKLQKLKTSAKTLVDTVLTSQYTNVALVSFSGTATNQIGFTSYTNKNSLKNKIDSLSASGGTNIQAGIYKARALLQSSSATNKYIILLSDGEPTYSYKANSASSYSGWTNTGVNTHNFKLNSFYNYSNSNIVGWGDSYYIGIDSYNVNGYLVVDNGIGTISEGLLARNQGITVFTIGYNISNSDRAKYVLRNVAGSSSNFYNSTTANLQVAFSKIAGKIQSIYPATSGTVTDPIGSKFDYVAGSLVASNGTTASYNSSNRTISWDVGTVSDGSDITLTYKVKIKSNAVNGTLYPTNGTTTFSYVDSNGNNASKNFVVPQVGINTIEFSYREKGNDSNVLGTDSITKQLGTSYTVPSKTFIGYTYDSTVDPNNGTVVYPSSTVKVYYTKNNSSPDAVDDTASTNEDVSVDIDVLANDTDIDGDTLNVTGTTNPSHGTVSINADKTIKYTPSANYNGTDTFTYTISDGNGGEDTATVTVTVEPVNDAPDAVDDTASTNEDVSVDIDVLANDTDIDGDTLSVTGTTNPSHGTVSINADKTIKYTPSANYNGTDTFTYTISDGNGGEDTATVTVTVEPVNDAPDAVDDTASTNEDVSVDIDVLANDTDIDGDTLSVTGTTNPSHGTVSINADKTIKYTPSANYNGTDTFTYTISDGNGGEDTATVTVTVEPVNDAPDAVDDTASTNEDVSVDIDVLANDTDIDGDTLNVTGTTNPSHGTVSINADKTIKYTPSANYNGTDTFTYTISDGNGGEDTATVTVTVEPVNDAPDAIDDVAITNEDTSIKIDVLNNDSDVDGDSLKITKVTPPSHGIAYITLDKKIKYVPAPNYNGTDTFTYTISDGHGGTDTATVKVTVVPVNDAPIALDDWVNIYEDTSIDINVLFNDFDFDMDTLSVTGATSPSHGTVTILSNNKIKYTPNANYNGPDSFKYTISDGHGGTDTATVRILVWAVNDAPDAVDDSATTDEDTSVDIDVLANDIDVEGDTLTIDSTTNPFHGAVAVNLGGTITYTPNANWYGIDTFTYTIKDGKGGEDTATVTVIVKSINDAPNAADDSAETNEDTSVDIDILANDTDPDGDVLSVKSISEPQHGNAVLNADGTIKYTPQANWYGTDTFTYVVTDANKQEIDLNNAEEGETAELEGTDTATVTIVVKPVNDAPDAVDDSAVTDEDTKIDINVLDNDTDVDGDTLSVIAVDLPAHGSAVLNADGTISYTPEANWSGTEKFEYTISDSNGGKDTATVTVTVNPANDAPTANDSSITTKEDTAVKGTVTGSDIDGDDLTFILDKEPEHGKVTLNSNGTYTYTPNADYNGKDSFTFMSNDGNANSEPATVSITITPVDEKIIPKTGETFSYVLYGMAGLLVLAGVILLIIRRKKSTK